jgi:hypothetical protein
MKTGFSRLYFWILIGAFLGTSSSPASDSVSVTASDSATDSSSIPQTDLSTLSQSDISSSSDVCLKPYTPDAKTQSGHQIKMLGAAIVYEGPSNGQSIMGHLGERFSFCRDTEYFDALYDYAPLASQDFNQDFAITNNVSPSSFTDEEKSGMIGHLYEEVNANPGQAYGAEQYLQNRTIYEAWLNLDGALMYKMMIANVDRYDEQIAKIQAHKPLPPYKIPSDDCMTPVLEDLQLVNPGYVKKHTLARLSPVFLYDYAKGHGVDRIIVYPSQRDFRILRLKAEGKSTAFDWFLPTQKVSGAFGKSWALIYAGGAHGLLGHAVLRPAAGIANFAVGVAEMSYGAVTMPFKGKRRFLFGLEDILASAAETFSLQVRYPLPSPWTQEEKEFFQNFAQNSVLLKYLELKYEDAKILVDTAFNEKAERKQ